MIRVSSKTSDRTSKWLERISDGSIYSGLDSYGRMGVEALSRATPVDTGLSADSWDYTSIDKDGRYGIAWHNYNVVAGVPVVILLQYGHGTGTGGYVQGRDFINPAIEPVFDEIEKFVIQEVNKR